MSDCPAIIDCINKFLAKVEPGKWALWPHTYLKIFLEIPTNTSFLIGTVEKGNFFPFVLFEDSLNGQRQKVGVYIHIAHRGIQSGIGQIAGYGSTPNLYIQRYCYLLFGIDSHKLEYCRKLRHIQQQVRLSKKLSINSNLMKRTDNAGWSNDGVYTPV